MDGELGRWARSRLVLPEDTLDRLERAIAQRRLVSASMPDLRESRRGEACVTARKQATAAVFAVAVALLGTQLVGVEVVARRGIAAGQAQTGTSNLAEPRGRAPDSRPSVSSESGGATRGTGLEPAPAWRPTADTGGTRRFALVPVESASGYRVEFFRGARRIYVADTATSHLDLPASWKFRGRSERLSPGVYRWYVWPTHGDRRAASATVQAELVIG